MGDDRQCLIEQYDTVIVKLQRALSDREHVIDQKNKLDLRIQVIQKEKEAIRKQLIETETIQSKRARVVESKPKENVIYRFDTDDVIVVGEGESALKVNVQLNDIIFAEFVKANRDAVLQTFVNQNKEKKLDPKAVYTVHMHGMTFTGSQFNVDDDAVYLSNPEDCKIIAKHLEHGAKLWLATQKMATCCDEIKRVLDDVKKT